MSRQTLEPSQAWPRPELECSTDIPSYHILESTLARLPFSSIYLTVPSVRLVDGLFSFRVQHIWHVSSNNMLGSKDIFSGGGGGEASKGGDW